MSIKILEKILPINIIKYNVYLRDYSTFGIGGKTVCLLEPTTIKELIKCIKACITNKFKYQVIGNGSNILFKSSNEKRVIITTKKLERIFKLKGDEVCVSAGVFISELILWCKDKGLSGLEELYGIPATIGGMVMMNAGAFNRQIFDNLIEIETLCKGKKKTIKKEDIKIGHHFTNLLKTDTIVLSAKFKFQRLAPSVISSKIKEIIKLRLEKQPLGKSAGCVFRPTSDKVPAGLLIDKAGLKGLSVGGAVVSEKHANFILNSGAASDKDVKALIKIIKTKVKEQFNISLKREIEFIGDRDGYYR